MALATYTLKAFDRWNRGIVSDEQLVIHAREVEQGKHRAALGSQLYKKDMGPRNGLRAFIYVRSAFRAAYLAGIAKADEANVDTDTLEALREIAKKFDAATQAQVDELVNKGTYRKLP